MKPALITIILAALPFLCPAQIINRFAGTGTSGHSGDGGPATAAQFQYTFGVTSDLHGNVYLTDTWNNCVRKVDTAGIITNFAGNSGGTSGYSGDGGPATNALLHHPIGLFADTSGNVYIADVENNCVRKVNSAGIISTVAGNGSLGYSGDGGAATLARLNQPEGVVTDGIGNIYIADLDNHRVRRVDPAGIITTYAGTGATGFSGDGAAATAASLSGPRGVSEDTAGNLYIADASNNRIRKVSPAGIISTIAGSSAIGSFGGDGGPATAARLSYPCGTAMDAAGNLYIADGYNYRVRKINTSGIISTFAGDGSLGFFGDGGPATNAIMQPPTGINVDVHGNIYIGDYLNHEFRVISCLTIPFPVVAPITGPSSVCLGDTITLSDTSSGGFWFAVGGATVSSAGDVVGVTTGTAIIHYGINFSCGHVDALYAVAVNTLPVAGSISGPSAVCAGHSITLTESGSSGGIGVWSGSGPVSVFTGGLVSGVSAGAATISYVVTNVCGADTSTYPIAVDTLPRAGTITGRDTLCMGDSIALSLSGADTGGVWAGSGHITVSGTGRVSGISVGTSVVSYTVTNLCGTSVATKPIVVKTCPSGIGNIVLASSAISINPNPATDHILVISVDEPITELVITDLPGRVVFSETCNRQCEIVSIGDFPPGLYLVRLNGQHVMRIVKQ